ncbi:MAG TPA: VOC family protein [Polyangiaceae bacterium]|jgi:uncharacterized glyoxalase superfamily protein PhnB
MKITKATPILVVDRIEPALALWTGPLGYEKTVEVPDGDRAAFVLLVKDGHEVMLQTRASVEGDLPAMAKLDARVAMYLDVPSLAAAKRELEKSEGVEVLVPERTTFYGARELWIRDGAGNVIGFAEHVGTR